MSWHERVQVVQGDITKLRVDAIVNAANESLIPGGGVDAAISAAGGPKMQEERRRIGGCPTGEARITGGYNLPARHVIHTVGPIWSENRAEQCDELLRSCYESSLRLAHEYDVETIAFPSISTGVYGFPIERAAPIAVGAVRAYLEAEDESMRVTFACFSDRDRAVYERVLANASQ